MKSNRFENAHLVGQRVKLADERLGTITYAGYGIITVDIDDGCWYSGSNLRFDKNGNQILTWAILPKGI
jgi:hypothetical protein